MDEDVDRTRRAPQVRGDAAGTSPGEGSVVTVVPGDALTAEQLQEWRELEASADVVANPFLVPEWVLSWYACYVPPADRLVLLVRQRKTGQLIGLAPLRRQHLRVGPLRVGQRLVPVGGGVVTPFELPGFLAAAGHHREVLRSIVKSTSTTGVDWGQITIAPTQGWFEPEHILGTSPPGRRAVDFWQHTGARACVMLGLGPTWEETRTGLKRNVKESLRRSANRLTKSGLAHEVRHRSGAEVDEVVVRRLLDLHRARSSHGAATVEHADYYRDPTSRRLMLLAVPALAARGRASVFELELEGRVIAAQLVLHAPGVSYVHSSGFLPETWEYGPVTHLVGAVVRSANEQGDRFVNFSPGPRVAKLRWSEDCWVWSDFTFGSGPRRMLTRYLVLRAAAATRPGMSQLELSRQDG